jgi:N-methylhydantoinase A
MEGAYREAKIYDRKKCSHGNILESPAIIEQADSTTVLFPGFRAEVDKYRNLVITKGGEK